MDPNAALTELRGLLASRDGAPEDGTYVATMDRIADLAESLDEWLTRGGFVPGPWERKSDAMVTMADLHALSEITDACIHGRKVARLIDGDNVIEGVARSIGDENGNFLRRDEDVRNGYLRVSGTFEYFWPIRELMPQIHDSTFVVQRGA